MVGEESAGWLSLLRAATGLRRYDDPQVYWKQARQLREALDTLPAVYDGEAHEPASPPASAALADPLTAWTPALVLPAVRPVARGNVPPVPDLRTLPRIPSGRYAGERQMTVRQFAGLCGVAVKTVRGWLHQRQVIPYEKRGAQRQSRIVIASGERERRLDRIGGRRAQRH